MLLRTWMGICGQNQPSDAESFEIRVSLTSEQPTGVECRVLLTTYTTILLVCISNLMKKPGHRHTDKLRVPKQRSAFVCFANLLVNLVYGQYGAILYCKFLKNHNVQVYAFCSQLLVVQKQAYHFLATNMLPHWGQQSAPRFTEPSEPSVSMPLATVCPTNAYSDKGNFLEIVGYAAGIFDLLNGNLRWPWRRRCNYGRKAQLFVRDTITQRKISCTSLQQIGVLFGKLKYILWNVQPWYLPHSRVHND